MSTDDDDTTTAPKRIIHVLLSYDDTTQEQRQHLRELRHKDQLSATDADYICAIVRRLLLE
jgi:hypothetical protein